MSDIVTESLPERLVIAQFLRGNLSEHALARAFQQDERYHMVSELECIPDSEKERIIDELEDL